MILRKTEGLKVGFIIKPEHLTRINEIATEIGVDVKFILHFSDQSSSRAELLSSMLAFQGWGGRSIESIEVVSEWNSNKSFSAKFSSIRVGNNVEYEVLASENEVDLAFVKIRRLNEDIRVWYSWFAFADLLILFITLYAIYLAWWLPSLMKGNSTKVLSEYSILIVVLSIIFGVICFKALNLLVKFKEYIFPKGVFYVGNGEERDKKRMSVRNTLSVILLGLLTSGVIAILQRANYI